MLGMLVACNTKAAPGTGPAIPLGWFRCEVMDGRIYVGGGELIDTRETIDSLEVLDPASGIWSGLPDLQAKLHGVPVLAVQGILYVSEGSTRSADVINWGRVFALWP
jgi:hypothetical protein